MSATVKATHGNLYFRPGTNILATSCGCFTRPPFGHHPIHAQIEFGGNGENGPWIWRAGFLPIPPFCAIDTVLLKWSAEGAPVYEPVLRATHAATVRFYMRHAEAGSDVYVWKSETGLPTLALSIPVLSGADPGISQGEVELSEGDIVVMTHGGSQNYAIQGTIIDAAHDDAYRKPFFAGTVPLAESEAACWACQEALWEAQMLCDNALWDCFYGCDGEDEACMQACMDAYDACMAGIDGSACDDPCTHEPNARLAAWLAADHYADYNAWPYRCALTHVRAYLPHNWSGESNTPYPPAIIAANLCAKLKNHKTCLFGGPFNEFPAT